MWLGLISCQSLGKRQDQISAEVIQHIEKKYYRDLKNDASWITAKKKMEPFLLSQKPVDHEFQCEMNELILYGLTDLHTGIVDGRQYRALKQDKILFTGFQMSLRDGEFIVTQLKENGIAEKSGVQLGMRCVGYDECRGADFKAEQQKWIQLFADERRGRLVHIKLVLNKAYQIIFKGMTESGKTVACPLEYQCIPAESHDLVTTHPALDGQKDICYVQFQEFNRSNIEQLIQFLRKRNEKLWIVDLRYNGGGELSSLVTLLDVILPNHLLAFQTTWRFPKWVHLQYDLGGRKKLGLGKKIVVLTGYKTASAAEIFAQVLKENGLAQIIGQKTMGTVRLCERRAFAGIPMQLNCSVASILTGKGVDLEGRGVVPDREIVVGQKLNSEDECIKSALEELRRD
jgi:C-terminal processing protease CtpA/Prc